MKWRPDGSPSGAELRPWCSKPILNRTPLAASRVNPELIPDLGLDHRQTAGKRSEAALPVRRRTAGRPQTGQAGHRVFRSSYTFTPRNGSQAPWRKPAIIAAAISLPPVAGCSVVPHRLRDRWLGGGNHIHVIAVLPFVNVGADPNIEYLADGVTEGIISSLSRVPELRVMARSTVFSYKGREVNAQKIGKELNVDAVLMGRVTQREILF